MITNLQENNNDQNKAPFLLSCGSFLNSISFHIHHLSKKIKLFNSFLTILTLINIHLTQVLICTSVIFSLESFLIVKVGS